MYGLRGLGSFNPPARPTWIDPGYPPDAGIVALNTANNNAYQAAMDIAQAQNNYDQCEANAQNANSQAQYDEVMARCRGQAAIQAAPDNPILTYYTPGKPISYSPGGPAITPPVYEVPVWAQQQQTFTPPATGTPAPSSGGSPAGGGATPAPGGAGGSGAPDVELSDYFGLLPWWAWAGGAAVLVFGLGGARGR